MKGENDKSGEYVDRILAGFEKSTSGTLDSAKEVLSALNDQEAQISQEGLAKRFEEAGRPISRPTISKLAVIGNRELMTVPNGHNGYKYGQYLPNSWRTLYELCELPDEDFLAGIENGTINPEMTRRDAIALKKPKRPPEPIQIPDGEYQTIVIDPPWPMEKIEREVTPNQVFMDYPLLSLEEIQNMEMPAAETCHLYCWTTHKFLPFTLNLVEAWGFKYLVTMVWHKPGGFQPFGLPQYNCEFIVLARRGGLPFQDTKAFPVCFNAPRREHSRKPDEFYDLVRRVSPGPRIDIFSREERDGFAQFGNETEKFVEGKEEVVRSISS